MKFLIFFQKMLHSVEKCKRGPFLIYKHTFYCKITKNSKGDPLGIFENFQKNLHSAKKIERGDPLVSSGFVGYGKKTVKKERGTLWRQKKIKKSRTVSKKKSKSGTL